MDFKYPYTDYHELNLDWFLSEFKNLVETWARTQQDWISMQEYIRDYFDNLNVQTEIDNKINAMIMDGTFGAIVEPFVTAALPALVAGQLPDVVAAQIGAVVAAQIGAVVAGQLPAVAADAAASLVSDWLAAHIDPDTGYVIDDTLTVSQAAADAKIVGDYLIRSAKIITLSAPQNNVYITSGGVVRQIAAVNSFKLASIAVSEGDVFTINSILPSSDVRAYYFTDASDVAIEYPDLGYSMYNQIITCPAGATKLYINYGAVNTTDLCYYGIAHNVSCSRNNFEFDNDIVVGKNLQSVYNWFDKNSAGTHMDGYYNRSGVFTPSNTLGQSDYIPVISNAYYYTPLTNVFVLWFDAEKNQIGASNFTDGKVYNGDAAYGKFIFNISDVDEFYVKCDNLKYVPEPANPYKNKVGVAFGTSLTYRSLSTGGYLNYLPDLLDMTFVNKGIGNATILVTPDYPNLDILAEVKNYTDYADSDICILEGFVNDFFRNADKLGQYTDTAETTVCGCVRSALSYIQTQNEDITVFLILDHYGTGVNASTAKNSQNITQYEYYEEIAKVAESMGVIVIKQYAVSEMNEKTTQYFIDNIHPTPLGARQSAYVIADAMNTHSPKQK